mgnify:CR=1 FL=1
MQITNERTGVSHYTTVRYQHNMYAARVYRISPSGEHTCSSYTLHPTRHKARHYADGMVKALAGTRSHKYTNE